jgi:hypothetical protein
MANTYRKLHDSDTWHFCSNCSHWPTSGYATRADRPSHKELCAECRAKKVNDNCQ